MVLDLQFVERGIASSPSEQPTPGPQELTPAARALAEHLASVLGAPVRAILHYGSRAQGRASRADSAFDFFVIVDGYRRTLQALAARRRSSGRVGLRLALAWVLPPSAVSVRRSGRDGEREAKCMIISTRHFRRECAGRARDHFVRARLSQHVLLAWSRDPESMEEALNGVRAVREGCFAWLRVFLPPRFDVTTYCRTLLAVSLAHEIRPEAGDHAEILFTAQRDALLRIYGPLLEQLHARRLLIRDGDGFRQPGLPGPVTRLRVGAYFRLSKWRTTLRLLKHPFLYDGWLDYLVHKIERSSGQRVELTERERRWPLVLLWPRAIRYLRTRPQQQRRPS